MNDIIDQIDKVVAAIKLPKPELKLVPGWRNSIRLELNNQPTILEDDIVGVDPEIVHAVKNRTRVKLDLRAKAYTKHVDYDEVRNSLRNSICQRVKEFLSQRGGYANNRLSKTYKWYREYMTESALRQNHKLETDMYNISKFISQVKDEDGYKAVRTLLNVIKDRYEPSLGSI